MPNQNEPPAPPQLKAATLQYDREKSAAPKLTAKGRGLVADKILALAAEHNIPVHRDADLIEILEKTEIDTEIPLEVYAIVAEIFAFIYKVNQQKKITL
ncbi:MAG: hypothetical protein EON60_00345 [Alphaproteobacteria bacterium]|nr:MAG: hypothetical protein EON60_00345 [Alphaproteobacteria bacterium]